MTPEHMITIREAAALTQAALAQILRSDISTIGRWERGERAISGPASIVLEMLEAGDLPDTWRDAPGPAALTGADLAAIRKRYGLTLRGLCGVLRMKDERTARRWEKGEYAVTGPASIVLELMRAGRLPPRFISG